MKKKKERKTEGKITDVCAVIFNKRKKEIKTVRSLTLFPVIFKERKRKANKKERKKERKKE